MFRDLREGSIKMPPRQAHRGTFVGTPHWVSPEMLNENSSGPFVDLWALGVVLYEMVTGERPFKGTHELAIFDEIKNRKIKYPENTPEHAVDLIEQLLQLNPLERLGYGLPGSGKDFDALKAHPFFNGINFQRLRDRKIAPPIDRK